MHPPFQKKMNKLDADLSALLKKLAPYSDEQLNAKPSKDVWSVLQCLQHLMLAEEQILKYIKKKLSFNPILEDTNFNVKLRRFLLVCFLRMPFKFKAPKGVGEENFPAVSSLKEVAEKWGKLRKELASFLEAHSENLRGKIVYKHPLSGPMTLKDLLDFYDVHFVRHRKQLENVLKNFAV